MQRRRFIKILATSAAGLNVARLACAHHSLEAVQWQGYTLGAEGSFTLYTENKAAAQAVLQRCFAEIQRLERLFSLYDHHSELSQLNRTGQLLNPTADWLPLLEAINHAHTATNGLFDPTIQPVWKAYDAHFKTNPASVAPELAVRSALTHTGWQHVSYDPQHIHFQRQGMQLTLNGIAQGAITDRVTELLTDAGYQHVLVELGETRAIGPHPEHRPWNIGIKDASQPTQLKEVVELDNQALATSGGYGSPFSKDGHYHHLIHPQTGLPQTRWRSLSVIAPTATEADALSTGLSFASAETIAQMLQKRPDLQVLKQA